MSQAESEDSARSERATPYKLQRARQRGLVARGQDLAFFAGLLTVTAALTLFGYGMGLRLSASAARIFVSAPVLATSPATLLTYAGAAFRSGLQVVGWIAAGIFATVLVFEFIQTGPVFSFESLKLDFSRLSPANGFKRVFSLRMLLETGKSLLKLAVYALLAIFMIWLALWSGPAVITDARSAAQALRQHALSLMGAFVVAALAFALLDQFIARGAFARRMMMSRRELRRELRDREGDPRLRQRRRQLHRQLIKANQSLRDVRDADVLITNPMHFAVGLRYDPRTMTAPLIVAQGANNLAHRLRRIAFLHGVVIIQDPPLARTLYQRGELSQAIPEAYFRKVAELYISLRARGIKTKAEQQNV